jgi:Ca2+-binding EF-hand superfamily protein
LNSISLKNISITQCTCLALCIGFGLSFNAAAAGKNVIFVSQDSSKRIAEADAASANDGMQQTLQLNFSPENREKIRKALDDYARSVDHDHDQIEERRRAMQESIKERFLDADSDGDGTIDRQEATYRLPQIARHFSQVDTNQDNVISLDELEEAQVRILERRKAAEAALEAKKLQDADTGAVAATKRKSKQASDNTRKRAL